MPTKSVPAKPNLEFDRKQAKELLVALTTTASPAENKSAQARFIAHHPRGLIEKPQLADALLVVAREYGFGSWPQWKVFVETRQLDRAKQAAIAAKAICSNNLAHARVLLSADSALACEDVWIACACGEVEIVRGALARDLTLVNCRGGPNGWEPLQYACFSRFLRADPVRAVGIVEVARLLLTSGADANAHHLAEWQGDRWRETVLFGAAGIANHAELTRLLLDNGADVNEGFPEPQSFASKKMPVGPEALYHACEFRDTTCLALLLGAKPHAFSVSYTLGRMLDFENREGVRLFLAHGADANFRIPWFEHRTHLHRAIASDRSAEILTALLDAGGNPMLADDRGVTPYCEAVRRGRADVIASMERGGASGATAEDRLVGQLLRGERASGVKPESLHPDYLCDAARHNDVHAITALLNAGADINACNVGDYGSPPLHWAAWRGRFAAVRLLVERGADIHWVNSYGGAALGTAIHGSANCFDYDGGPAMRLPEEAVAGEYVEIVEFLIAHGAKLPKRIWYGRESVNEVLRRHGVPDVEDD